jgi:hypothetical protein
MKANIKSKLYHNDNAYSQVVTGIVALLLTIVIGVMIYYEVDDGVDQFSYSSYADTFTTYEGGGAFVNWLGGATGSNHTGGTIVLDNTISSISNFTAYNASYTNGAPEDWGVLGTDYHINGKRIVVHADELKNFTQLNITYTTNVAGDGVEETGTASTVFSLVPLIALVVIAAIILGLVLMFGAGGKKGGGL